MHGVYDRSIRRQFCRRPGPWERIEAAWAAFRASLTCAYDTFTVASSLGGSVTVTDATEVQVLADGLRTPNATQVNINGVDWFVGSTTSASCRQGGGHSVEFTNRLCTCLATVSVRPNVNNLNWGGVNAATCGPRIGERETNRT